MLTIGLLGGMSWESSAEYYRLANELVRNRLGGLHSARCVLFSVDFAEIEQKQVAGEWHEAGEILGRGAAALEAAGADLFLLCTNTMHKVADQVQAAVSIPLLHIVDVTADAVRAAGLTRIGLLATGFTMEQDFYRDRMAGHGIEVIVPSSPQRDFIHRVIYQELCRGVIDEGSRAGYREVIAGLVESGAEGVILGCTEIELLVSAEDSPVPVFPTTRLHVAAAIDWAFAASAPSSRETVGQPVAAQAAPAAQAAATSGITPLVDHCVIAVSDWDRSNAFYRDVLGAEVVQNSDARWAYRFGVQQLNVHGPGVEIGTLVAHPAVVPGGSDLCFRWPHPIEDAGAHLARHDVPIEVGPVRRFGAGGAGSSLYFRDPDGSLLEFISYEARA